MASKQQQAVFIASAWMIPGVFGLFWWGLLIFLPASRPYFDAYPEQNALFRLILPDTLLFCGLALLTGVLYLMRNRKARFCAMLQLGATLYATLYCLQASIITGRAWLACIMMTLALIYIFGLLLLDFVMLELKKARWT